MAFTSAGLDEICYVAHSKSGADHAGLRCSATQKWRGGLLGARVSSRHMSNFGANCADFSLSKVSMLPKLFADHLFYYRLFSTACELDRVQAGGNPP